jgi:hypothetical protein
MSLDRISLKRIESTAHYDARQVPPDVLKIQQLLGHCDPGFENPMSSDQSIKILRMIGMKSNAAF